MLMCAILLQILQFALLFAVVVYQKHIGSVADAEQFESDCRCQRRG